MTLEKARKIIQSNFCMDEGSLCLLLHDECVFSEEAFWDFHKAVATVIQIAEKEACLTAQITVAYQRFLQEIIFHFDPKDVAEIKGFPENYYDYIERLDYAIRAYLENKPDLLEDNLFDLQRTPSNLEKQNPLNN